MVGGIGNGNLDFSGWNIFFENGSTGIPPSLNPEERVENPLFVDSNKDLSLAAGESPVERLISASTLPTQVPVEITAPGSLFDSLSNELIIKITAYFRPADLSAFARTSQKGRLFVRVEQAKRGGYTKYDLDGALQHLYNSAKKKAINDQEIVLAAVKQNGSALQYASKELRHVPEIVMAAVKQNGCALQYASEELRHNLNIVKAAVQQDGCALKYASDAIRKDRETPILSRGLSISVIRA